jgi:hypothetical protein
VRKRRAVQAGPYAVQHFETGTVAIVGSPERGRVSLCVLTGGNPSGALTVSGTASAMGQLAEKLGRIVLAVARRRR